MAFAPKILVTLFTAITFLVKFVISEPVQYCKYGADTNEISFCMGMLMHRNISTSSHDLYLSMSVTRPGSNSLGWTALGLGPVMEGALMFIVYGDPLSGEQPIVSIRKSIGHKQPTLVTRQDMNGADLRVMRADWHPSPTDPDSAVARVSLVCYSCHLWPGTSISAMAKSQPWMWAWNSKQDIAVFTYDAHLKMHAHHAGMGGWGNFYVDMARSINDWAHAPSFPPIRPGVHALGASEVAFGVSWLKNNPVLHLHGFLMGAAFLLLFPTGVVAMRAGSSKAFKYHWVLQLVASGFAATAFVLGLALGRRIDTLHQVLGITLIACLGVQSLLGWRHHMVFLRLRRRTWLSHSHIWLGRFVMLGGWCNLLTGLVLGGYSRVSIGTMGGLVVTEALGLATWLWRLRVKATREKLASMPGSEGHKFTNDEYFALGDDEDEDTASVSSGTLNDDEARPMVEKASK